MKCCSSCTRWKTAAEFYDERRPHRSRDGKHHACKDCCRREARERARQRYVPRNTMTQIRDECGRFRRSA